MPELPPVRTPAAWTRAKWALFRLLELAANARAAVRSGAGATTGVDVHAPAVRAEPWLWVFASTIGELNAIEPLLRALAAGAGNPPLLLLSDHEHYRDSYLARYPGAAFAHFQGGSGAAKQLTRAFPPRALVIAEIPCILSDAPCRFSFAALYELKRRGVPVCVVNGWLYRESPASRLDALEKRLFDRDYVRLVDSYAVQTEEVKRDVIAAGADASCVTVTGNIKFDALARTGWSPDRAKSPELLGAIAASRRPCVVAGNVTNLDDQTSLLDVFRSVLAAVPGALLVLAPRHPEVTERMEKLASFLLQRGLRHAFRSQLGGAAADVQDLQVLVLDTMGELRDFYAVANVTFVGRNHNVLEPLAFDKPVFVKPGWEKAYPSYPVYQLLRAREVLIEVEEDDELAHQWIAYLTNRALHEAGRRHIEAVLESERGATGRCLQVLAAHGVAGVKA